MFLLRIKHLATIESSMKPTGCLLYTSIYARSELAAPQRFTVMETDDGYAVWDDIQDGIHVEPDGVSEEFTSEWEAETYRQQLIEKVQEREAKDWLYVEQSKQNLQQDIPFPDVEFEEAPESARAETEPVLRPIS